MHSQKQTRLFVALLMLAAIVSLNCNTWTRFPQSLAPATQPTARAGLPIAPTLPAGATPVPLPTQPGIQEMAHFEPAPGDDALNAPGGEPAGCLPASAQASLQSSRAMLDYADSMLDIKRPLVERLLPDTWNGYTRLFSFGALGVISLSVDDVDNEFLIQSMMNALQVAGFVPWLRRTSDQGFHILAIPLLDPQVLESEWRPYIQAYWLSRTSLPSGDSQVLYALKLPPCGWMVELGFAPALDASWWGTDAAGWPNYASVAQAYLADTNQEAARVARRIDWLGEKFPEGPDTMCGPLVWSIMKDAGVFPPGWGGWSEGSKAFWLANPEKNGRPWSLFPRDSYQVYSFRQPLGTFDFTSFPLYPGDFLYTYSARDGFDHMLLVTETDDAGNVYTVTNIVRVEPEKQTTIERVLLLNRYDPSVGIARNQWARDKVNGRTGHAGFDVFRWAWMEKDIRGEPIRVVVQPGDTLRLVAARWRTPVERIAEYNNVTIQSALVVGQTLLVPPY